MQCVLHTGKQITYIFFLAEGRNRAPKDFRCFLNNVQGAGERGVGVGQTHVKKTLFCKFCIILTAFLKYCELVAKKRKDSKHSVAWLIGYNLRSQEIWRATHSLGLVFRPWCPHPGSPVHTTALQSIVKMASQARDPTMGSIGNLQPFCPLYILD